MLKLTLVACTVLIPAMLVWAVEPLPTGASLAWTSNDSVVVKARDLVQAGSWADAEKLLQAEAKTGDESAQTARAEMLEIIRRLRQEYTQSPDAILARLKRSIPDVTAADLEKWRSQGHAQFRMVDGALKYHSREPGAILLACPEAKQRAAEHAEDKPSNGPTPQQQLIAHLEKIVAAAKASGKTEVVPVRHHIKYSLTVRPNRPGAKEGSLLRCWLPYPQEYRQQKELKLIRTSPAKHTLAPNAMQGSELSGARQRTIYFEQRITDPAKPVKFEEEFEYVSYAYYPQLKDEDAKPLKADSPMAEYIAERPPHIVFTPLVRDIVTKVAGNEANPLVKARKLFEYVDNTIPWIPEQEYTVVPSLSRKGLETCMGDCGVQSSAFITLCRAAGIPARWQTGWEFKPGGDSMHDWVEFYVEPWGWLPADPSYGLQKSDDPAIHYFYVGHQDSYRMIVNLDYGWPLTPPKPSLRSEPMDFQRGEVELDGRNLYFDEWTYKMVFELKDVGESEK